MSVLVRDHERLVFWCSIKYNSGRYITESQWHIILTLFDFGGASLKMSWPKQLSISIRLLNKSYVPCSFCHAYHPCCLLAPTFSYLCQPLCTCQCGVVHVRQVLASPPSVRKYEQASFLPTLTLTIMGRFQYIFTNHHLCGFLNIHSSFEIIQIQRLYHRTDSNINKTSGS